MEGLKRLRAPRITPRVRVLLVLGTGVLLVLGTGALLAACSLLAPRLQTPTLSVESIALEHGNLRAQQLEVRMRVENPNDRALPVKSLDYTLYIEDEEAAHGTSDASFTVPALGEAQFDMHMTVDMAGTLLRLIARAGSGADRIDYRVSGRVELSRGLKRSIPFDHRGTFKLR